jgi:hypothetical protein
MVGSVRTDWGLFVKIMGKGNFRNNLVEESEEIWTDQDFG